MDKKIEDYINRIDNHININRHDIHGKNILITGSTSGIGREAALYLGELGANVYIHGTNIKEGKKLEKYISERIGTKTKFFKSDFSKLREVRAMSDMIKEHIDEIDILINNAGCFYRGNKTGTNGIEYTFLINYLSGFLLTLNLMPLLFNADNQSHIVFTSSSAHKSITDFNLNTVENNTMNNWKSYSRSKLANIMLSIELSRRLDNNVVSTTSVHPGMVLGTNFLRNLPQPIEKLNYIANKLPLPGASSKYEGAATVINPITETNYNNQYYNKFKPTKPSKIARDIKLQNKLWNYSLNVTNANIIDELQE